MSCFLVDDHNVEFTTIHFSTQ